MPRVASLAVLAVVLLSKYINAQTYSATYLPSNVPPTTEEGQTGTNQCGTGLNQTSDCQNLYINSVTDFCLFAPPNPGADSVIGNTERIEVAWCTKNGTGARLIPDGAITGAHFVQTPDFVQVTGIGDLTLLNIPVGDAGVSSPAEIENILIETNLVLGRNPIGGLVFSSAFGQLEQIHEWTNFMAADQFCIRACKPGPMAPTFCQHIYDVMGCAWNMPANYDPGFETCVGDSGEPMGVYGMSTFFQGQPVTPSAHARPSSSSCTTLSTIGNGFLISGTTILPPGATLNPSGLSAVSAPTPSSPTSAVSPGSSIAASSPLNASLGSSATSQAASSGSGTSHTPALTGTNTSSSATWSSNAMDGWERSVLTVGLTFIGSMVGALFIL
ncbi:hypothetical protein NLJ89_g9464 [Agrocybe chaxingu]|uniref:Uncharacterized protein n=1 Tax=Agrocybe chaxingu TaxID=84603 RepID=A0A9W8JT02_9AGAR|nr:hypothetical protein NLJ89_g9464 [Agrocybe chaxingu]